MTTINTIEDLVRLLDEKPEWAEALRSRLQTRELTELPGKFESFRAEMIQAMTDLARALTTTNDRLDQAEEDRRDLRQTVMDLVQTVKGLADAQMETNRRLDQAEEDRRDLRQTVEELAQTVGELGRTVDGLLQTVGELGRTVDGLLQTVGELGRTVDGLVQNAEESGRTVASLVQTVEGLVQVVTQTNERLSNFEEQTNRRFDRVEGDVRELRSELNGLRNDFAPVKAAHVRNAALREVADIARSIGRTLVRVLNPEEIYDLHRGKDTSGISSDQLKSFRYADLIIEAMDINGSTCYLTVEVSYTADKRDTSRSVRNAEFLTRFTGRPAFAGVAGVRFDDEIASGDNGAFLYQVYARHLEVD